MPGARCSGGHAANVTAKIPWKSLMRGDFQPCVLKLDRLEVRFQGLTGTEPSSFFLDRGESLVERWPVPIRVSTSAPQPRAF